jgi:hypothetical protein
MRRKNPRKAYAWAEIRKLLPSAILGFVVVLIAIAGLIAIGFTIAWAVRTF